MIIVDIVYIRNRDNKKTIVFHIINEAIGF
jgi:hypothetical protein